MSRLRHSYRFSLRLAGLPAMVGLATLASCTASGPYDIHISNRTSYAALVSLDGQARLSVPAGAHDAIHDVDRMAHTFEADLRVAGSSLSLTAKIPALPQVGDVVVCVLLLEGQVMQSSKIEDCEVGAQGPGVSSTISAIDRVPINQTRSIEVSLSPAPQPGAAPVVLSLARASGNAGAAVFADNGQTTLPITGDTKVAIKGVENSDVAGNMELAADISGFQIGLIRFSVRTWPMGMTRVAARPNAPSAGVLELAYQVQSESGDVADLRGEGLLLGECVEYAQLGAVGCAQLDSGGASIDFNYPSPPFRQGYFTDNPHVDWTTIGASSLVTDNLFYDHHAVPTTKFTDNQLIGFSTPNHAAYDETSQQYYRFEDPVLKTGPQTLYGPNSLHRSVTEAGGHWYYNFEKTDAGQPFSVLLELP